MKCCMSLFPQKKLIKLLIRRYRLLYGMRSTTYIWVTKRKFIFTQLIVNQECFHAIFKLRLMILVWCLTLYWPKSTLSFFIKWGEYNGSTNTILTSWKRSKSAQGPSILINIFKLANRFCMLCMMGSSQKYWSLSHKDVLVSCRNRLRAINLMRKKMKTQKNKIQTQKKKNLTFNSL
jgi:hypothetical protein